MKYRSRVFVLALILITSDAVAGQTPTTSTTFVPVQASHEFDKNNNSANITLPFELAQSAVCYNGGGAYSEGGQVCVGTDLYQCVDGEWKILIYDAQKCK